MKDRGKSLFVLVLLIGIILVGCSYYFVAKPKKAAAQALKTENDVLQSRVDTLEVYKKNEKQYEADIKKNLDEVAGVLEKYPADTTYEDVIMQAVNMQLASTIKFNTITMEDKEDVLEVSDETVQTMNRKEYISGMAYEKRECIYTGEMTYPALKTSLNQILTRNDRTGIKDITMQKVSAEEEIILGCSVVVDFYSVRGTDKVYVAPNIADYISGVENIFGVPELTEEEPENGETVAQ